MATSAVLRSAELRALFDELKTLPPDKKGAYGKEVNALRAELTELIEQSRDEEQAKTAHRYNRAVRRQPKSRRQTQAPAQRPRHPPPADDRARHHP